MTTELLHEGISLSDLLHRPSDSESKDIRAKTGAFAVSGTTLARGKGPLTSPPPQFVVPTGWQEKNANTIRIY